MTVAGAGQLDARDVTCPTCAAKIGTYCRRPSGHKAWSPHAARWDEWERQYGPLPLPDPEYADVDEAGQLSLGVAGDQRALPGLAGPRDEEE